MLSSSTHKRSKSMAHLANLQAEAIQLLALALKSEDNVHRRHRLPVGMLRVRHGIVDNLLQELLEDLTRHAIDTRSDTLHTTTTSETEDSGLGDLVDGGLLLGTVAGTSLTESLTGLTVLLTRLTTVLLADTTLTEGRLTHSLTGLALTERSLTDDHCILKGRTPSVKGARTASCTRLCEWVLYVLCLCEITHNATTNGMRC